MPTMALWAPANVSHKLSSIDFFVKTFLVENLKARPHEGLTTYASGLRGNNCKMKYLGVLKFIAVLCAATIVSDRDLSIQLFKGSSWLEIQKRARRR